MQATNSPADTRESRGGVIPPRPPLSLVPEAGRGAALAADDPSARLPDEVWILLRGTPKRIAFLTLHLHRLEGRPKAEAFLAATDCVCRRAALDPVKVKKAISEARAVVDYGHLGHIPLLALPLPSRPEAAAPLLARAVAGTVIGKAAQARSQRLGGARGGRRTTSHARLSQSVSKLIRLANGGDQGAADKLDEIAELLRDVQA